METAVNIPRARTRPPKNVNARAFAAGSGVTAALVAAAIVAFASVAAYVGFQGMPFGSASAPDSTVALSSSTPQAAALAAGGTAAAVAADPATPTSAALTEILDALPPGALQQAAGGAGPGSPVDNAVSGGSTDILVPPGPGPGGEPATPGALQSTVSGLDDAVGGLGLDLPLTQLTDPITKRLDNTVGGALNGAGKSVGAGDLGDKVNGALGGLLGN